MPRLSIGLAVVLLCHASPGIAQEGSDPAARGTGSSPSTAARTAITMGPVGTPVAQDLSGIGSWYPESYLL